MGQPVRIPEKELIKLRKRHNNGESRDDLAEEVGYHTRTLLRRFHELDALNLSRKSTLFPKVNILRKAVKQMKESIEVIEEVIEFLKVQEEEE
jgi:RNA-binding protein YhbY